MCFKIDLILSCLPMRNGFLLLENDIFPPIFFPKKRKHESLAVKVTPLYIIWFSSFRKLRFPSAIVISLNLEFCVNRETVLDFWVWCNGLVQYFIINIKSKLFKRSWSLLEIFDGNKNYSVSRMKIGKYFIQSGGRENLNSRTHTMEVHLSN